MVRGKRPLRCPFCSAEETERVSVEDKVMIVFPCMFSPLVGAEVPEAGLQAYLEERYGQETDYFRKQCDRLHARMAIRGMGSG